MELELQRGNMAKDEEKQEKIEDIQRKKLGGIKTMPFILGMFAFQYSFVFQATLQQFLGSLTTLISRGKCEGARANNCIK
jgi:hypothetical protein